MNGVWLTDFPGSAITDVIWLSPKVYFRNICSRQHPQMLFAVQLEKIFGLRMFVDIILHYNWSVEAEL